MSEKLDKNIVYEKLIYVLWCGEHDGVIHSCKTHREYMDFLRETKKHLGDCTFDCCSCQRCCLQRLEIEAQNIVNYIFDLNTIGHCGMECLKDCEFDFKERERNKTINLED